MPDPRAVALLAAKEFADARRNRWFLVFATAFAVVALGLAWLGVSGAAGSGYAGWNRTVAGLLNLVMLVVPLLGLTLGALAVAGERERGTLLLMLSQPITASELVLGKFAGLTAAVGAALLFGFGVAAAAVAAGQGGGSPLPFLAFLGLAAVMAAACVAVGLLISATAARLPVAAGVALLVWLALVLLGDLGLMGTAAALRLGARELLWATLANPLQLFKLAALLVARGGLEVLGPAGVYAQRVFGDALLPALAAALAAWVVVPLALAARALERRGGLP